jgi:hypothetical protein
MKYEYQLRAWGKFWAIVRITTEGKVIEIIRQFENLQDAVAAMREYRD